MKTILAALLALSVSAHAQEAPKCLSDFHKLRNNYAWKTGLFPIAGLTGIAESAVLGFSWEYGGWGAFKASLGVFQPAAEYAVQHVIPGVAVLGTLGYETYFIVRLTEANHGYRLLKDVYGLGSGKMLRRFTHKIQKQNPDVTEEQIRAMLKDADQKGLLCDGSWTRHGQNPKAPLRRRVASPGDMRKQIRSEL